MAHIRPFAGIHYSRTESARLSDLIAPPFDVLDEAGRGALQAKHPHNIVNIDLPHIPPKAAGPAEVYAKSNTTLQAWMQSGILVKDHRAALYPYTQTFLHAGRHFHRKGFFALVRLSPFGAGQVVPHERTYKGAIEDRLALMRATRAQLSPIFGLFSDPRNEITNALYHGLSRSDCSGTIKDVRHDLFTVTDSEVENHVIDLMKDKPVYIADGHHRYTTALQYQQEAEQANGGPLAPNDPANFCMFVLIGMQDDGLLILPTHRLIGGLDGFDIEAFKKQVVANFDIAELPLTPDRVGRYVSEELPKLKPHTMALYDGIHRSLFELRLKNLDVLKPYEPRQSEAWRQLDVAILQRYIFDEILQPKFAGGKELKRSYVSDSAGVVPATDGQINQLAFLVQSTPLHALEELGKHNEVMPPKSTFFIPKLATGMMINPLG